MSIQLELGCIYKARDGGTVKILRSSGHWEYPWKGLHTGKDGRTKEWFYQPDGKWGSSPSIWDVVGLLEDSIDYGVES